MATKTAGRARTAKKPTPAAKRTAPAPKKAARVVKKPAPTARQTTMTRKTIDPGWTWDDCLPLAQARQIGNTLYVSGQVAYDANGNLVGEGDIKTQTRQVFNNIKAVLAAAGARLEDIVKINTYITDQSKFMDMLEVRSEIFGNNPPASTAVVVSALAFSGLLIEVEAIAVKS
jgi:reactive intermediate/imine deaminase